MSLFLRSLRARLLQSGARRYLLYALGEIVLIVLGILLALQINNANVARGERQRETKYLRSIRLDLQKDLDSLRYQVEYRERRMAATRRLLAAMGGESLSVQELAESVVLTLYEERFTPSNVTVKDLIGSGNMNLITAAAIKEALFDLELLYQTNHSYIDHETFEYREFVARSIYVHADLERLKPVFLGEKTAADVGLAVDDFTELLRDATYKNGCVVAIWTSEEFVGLYRTLQQTSQRVIDLIDAELAKR
ncbi:MAG: hypothetical protein H6835_03695 [Planctomycetes bacterium]|nr:hypothetical protein [Planctomycetota bacterium]